MAMVIATDHRGYAMKEYIKQHYADITWIDVGAYNAERSDYPVFAHKAVRVVQEKKADAGILLCGSGVGMAMAVNRYKDIYAGVAWNKEIARISKEDDNINMLVLPADFVSNEEAIAIIECWMQATFKKDRYQQRLAMIDEHIIIKKL